MGQAQAIRGIAAMGVSARPDATVRAALGHAAPKGCAMHPLAANRGSHVPVKKTSTREDTLLQEAIGSARCFGPGVARESLRVREHDPETIGMWRVKRT